MDQKIDSNDVKNLDMQQWMKDHNGQTPDANTNYSQDAIYDAANDQGALSSDSTLNTTTQQNGLVTRNATLYAKGAIDSLASASVLGSGQQGVNFGIPKNLQNNLKVGSFKVIAQSYVGVVLENPATGERFQITNADLGTDSKVTTDGSGIAGTIGSVSLTGVDSLYKQLAPGDTVKYYDTSNNEIKNNNFKRLVQGR